RGAALRAEPHTARGLRGGAGARLRRRRHHVVRRHPGDARVGRHAGVRARAGRRGQLHHARSAVHHHEGASDHRVSLGSQTRTTRSSPSRRAPNPRSAAAARLVRSGRAVSLSRPFPKEPGPNNAFPAQHYMRTLPRGRGGFAADYYGIFYHGVASTHIDALCHTWDDEAMWNGRDPRKEITFDGATFGAIEHWADGILTRGVMLDVPRHRGVPCVTQETPVHGWELEDFLTKRGITLEPGDAVSVYCGREAWHAANPETPYGRPFGTAPQKRP